MAQLIAFKMLKEAKVHVRKRVINGPRMVVSLAAFRKARQDIPSFPYHTENTGGDAGASLQVARRIGEIVRGDYRHAALSGDIKKALSEVRKRFMCMLRIMPYRQIVEGGYVNQLLDDYLGLLLIADEDHDGIDGMRYIDERDYYYNHPKEVRKIALQMKYLVIGQ